MKYIFFKKIKNQRGFSLLEVTVAISLILIGLIGVISLSLQNIKTQNINGNTFIASQLAKEGIELIRNKRDSNWFDKKLWNDSLASGKYKIDYEGNFSPVASINEANLKINKDGYNSIKGDDSIFDRMIEINNDNPDYLDVKCTVRWQEKGDYHEYIVETYLYNWY